MGVTQSMEVKTHGGKITEVAERETNEALKVAERETNEALKVAERETKEALKLAAAAGAVALGVAVAAYVFGGSCNERKTMKAPGRDCRIFRDDFEKNPADYFRNLRK